MSNSNTLHWFTNRLVCPDCHSKIYDDRGNLSCPKCHRTFDRKGGILNLLPSEKSEHADIEGKNIQAYDDIKSRYEKIRQFRGARKIIADWSLTKIENTNFELVKPYIEGKNVLEIGCGRGYLSALVAQITGVAAFDISRGSLNYAKELGNFGDNVFYFQGNVYSIPFEAETFDIVIAAEVLEHLAGPDRAMREINRVLKVGGIVIASVPNMIMYFSPLVLLTSFEKIRHPLTTFRTYIKRQSDESPRQYDRPFLPTQFSKLFKESGFKVIKHKTSMLNFWLFPCKQIILYGDKRCPAITRWLVKLIIKSSDVVFDREFPIVKWFGTRQHILAKKQLIRCSP